MADLQQQKPRPKLRDALKAIATAKIQQQQSSAECSTIDGNNNNIETAWQWEDLLRSRSVKRLVREGRICVDDCIVTCAHTKLSPASTVSIDGHTIIAAPSAPARLFIYHKPCGVLTTLQDNWGRPDLSQVMETVLLRIPNSASTTMMKEMIKPVGRLDMHSRGLLLWTSDGRLARALTAPNSGIPRRYTCVVRGPSLLSLHPQELLGLTCNTTNTMEESLSSNNNKEGEDLQKSIAQGVVTAYGTFHNAQLVAASPIGTQQTLDQVHTNAQVGELKLSKEQHHFYYWPHLACRQKHLALLDDTEIDETTTTYYGKVGCGGERSDVAIDMMKQHNDDDDDDDENVKQQQQPKEDAATNCYSRVIIIVHEGKKREVRRLLGQCGYFVCDLYRTGFGAISLDDENVKAGQARVATSTELAWANQTIAQYEEARRKGKTGGAKEQENHSSMDTTSAT